MDALSGADYQVAALQGRDVQSPGAYRLEQKGDDRLFAGANGPQALKPYIFVPEEPLCRVWRTEGGFQVEGISPPPPRAGDLAGLAIQDRLFLQGERIDPYHEARREERFLVAVHCTHPPAICFCAFTGDGPRARAGFDIGLTALPAGYVAEAGSPADIDITEKAHALCADADPA